MRKHLLSVSPLVIAVVGALLSGCQGKSSFITVGDRTAAEVEVLSQSPFNPMAQVSDVDGSGNDSMPPNLIKTDAANPVMPMVRPCDVHTYEAERQAALDAARADTTRKTIPVRFAISVGSLFDDIAYDAHLRAILRADAPNETPIAVGAANDLSESTYNGANSLHYFVDHTQAKTDFKTGVKCFFDVVTINRSETGHGIYHNGAYDHPYNIMYYGDTYQDTAQVRQGLISPRLFKRVEQEDYVNQDPQIVPLYVIDIRNQALRLPNSALANVSFLNPAFASSAVRRQEYTLSFRDEFDLKALFTYYEQLVTVLSSNRRLIAGTGDILANGAPVPSGKTVYQMSGYEGVPQALRMIVSASSLQVDMMSTQYTPIVLDLGAPNILLSSRVAGSFFNLAGLQVQPLTPGGAITGVSHQTAWLGGSIVQDASPNAMSDSTPRRVADDGFLVLPDANGQINGSAQLFGSLMQVTVNGVVKTYANGFLALAALANKDCSSSDLKKQFVGPWDGDLYASKLKVWVDANRNGVADAGELKTLEDSRVGAIDACAVTQANAADVFGNQTKLRSAFLYLAAGEKAIGNESEILSRLTNGKRSDGGNAEFRVAIDVLFDSDPGFYLEDVDSSRIFSPAVPSSVVQMAGSGFGSLPILHNTLPIASTGGARR